MDNVVRHWVDRSLYDSETASDLLKTGKYLYVAFMCQQSVEKMLKSIIAHRGGDPLPTHNLVRLAELCGLKEFLTDEQLDFMADLTPYCIEARYGVYKESLEEIVDKNKALVIVEKTREMNTWLLQKIS